MTTCDVAIIGAGPYGLSIAAHLRACGVEFRIFGSPMQTWLTQMPKGMRLKSEGFASSLYDHDSEFTLSSYCKQQSLPYADTGFPIPLDTFTSYGLAFQKKFAPQVEDKLIVSLRKSCAAFELTLSDGEIFAARKVVVAVGIGHFGYVPPSLSTLPEEFVSHSSRHSTLEHFGGREVAVIGAGASALDLAALLHQSGVSVQLVARKSVIRFHDPPGPIPRPVRERLRHPSTGLGPGWKSLFYTSAPLVFHRLPENLRLAAMRRTLGPAPAWFVKQDVIGKVPFSLGVDIAQARIENGRVNLQLADAKGGRRTLRTDHVISATGFRVDLRRLTFLDDNVKAAIRTVEQTPILSSNFESSLPGLYFVGTAAANSFGPLLRFAFGARFTARRLTNHLQQSTAHSLARGRLTQRTPAF